jgi:hypothetical protein
MAYFGDIGGGMEVDYWEYGGYLEKWIKRI